MAMSGVLSSDLTTAEHVALFASVGSDQDYKIMAATLKTLPAWCRTKPARAVVVPSGGALTVRRLDGTNVTLPDPGGCWQWNIQHEALIASGTTAVNVVVLW